MSMAARIDEWLRPRVPVARLTAVRVLVGAFALVYVLVRFRYFADLSRLGASELAPVGIVRVLGAPLPPAATWAIAALTVALGVAFVRGTRLAVVAPAFFLALLWTTTYRSSWGKILHSENLLVLHVGVLALTPGCVQTAPSTEEAERGAGWTLRALSVVTVLTYVVAGIAKLRTGGLAWATGGPLAEWLAFDTLRKIELGSFASPLAPVLAARPSLCAALAVYTLAVELGAPISLVGARAGRLWSALAWAFHVGIVATMAIGFFYPVSGVAFVSFFDLERVAARLSRRSRRQGR